MCVYIWFYVYVCKHVRPFQNPKGILLTFACADNRGIGRYEIPVVRETCAFSTYLSNDNL